MGKEEAAHSCERDALAYPDGEVLALLGEELLDDGTMNEGGDSHHTLLHHDLPVHHNEVAVDVVDMSTLVVRGHDAEVAHKTDRNE